MSTDRGISRSPSDELHPDPSRSDDLAERAQNAMRELATDHGVRDSPTSASLSADEVLALAQVGYHPIGLVSGTAVARLGYNGEWSLRPGRSYEVPNLTSLLNDARTRAVMRMREHSKKLGSAGVVGAIINLEGVEHEGMATFVATGTAVRASGQGIHPKDGPFTCALSGHDFHLLVRSGAAPRALVVGTSAFHFGWRSPARWTRSQGRCVELSSLTQSLYGAREAAIARLTDRANRCQCGRCHRCQAP